MRIAHHGNQLLDMNQADRVIQVLPTKRKARMPGFDSLVDVRFEIIVHVQIDDFAPRRHDIAHNPIAQIEHVEHKFSAEGRYLG